MTKYQCLEHFLWFKPGQIVDEIDPGWTSFFKVIEEKTEEKNDPVVLMPLHEEDFEDLEEEVIEPKKRGRKKKGSG
jgi:hypothetical protein